MPDEQDREAITDAEMQHLKRLSRLHLSDEDTERAKADLNKILGYFARLSELDTTNLPEMARPVALVNVMREDEPREGLSQQEALALGVATAEGFFKVPRLVD